MTHASRPPGITALSFFFLFGTVMSGLASLTLLFPGSVLEPLWRLNLGPAEASPPWAYRLRS